MNTEIKAEKKTEFKPCTKCDTSGLKTGADFNAPTQDRICKGCEGLGYVKV